MPAFHSWSGEVKRLLALPAICGALLFSGTAVSAVIKIGDTVYVDGKEYTWAEWKKLRDDPELQKQALPAASQGVSTPARAPATAVRGARAASCTTPVYYDEFPKEGDEFECTGGLGSLTREQLLDQGWKVDFVEKLPPPVGQPTTSPRGLPLNLYKLVISR
jgi:hypothetical protein